MSMKRDAATVILAALLAGCAPPAQTVKPTQVAQPAAAPRPIEPTHADSLGDTVTARIHALDATAFRAVTAQAVGGRVLLTGAVVKPEQRRRAERTAAAMSGVVAVTNEVLLAEDAAFNLFIPDTARESALTARLATDESTGHGAFELRVVNHIAYVIAAQRSPDQTARVKELLTEDPNVKWVVLVTQP